MKILSSLFVLAAFALFPVASLYAAPQTGLTAQQAVDTARTAVDPALQGKVVSVYGTGTTTGIDTWWIIFYDPSVDSHGRGVKIVNGQAQPSYPAQGGIVYADSLTFATGDVRGIGKALATAEDYAARHSIPYNQVRALLRLTSHGDTLRWRVQLLDNGTNKGVVFVDAASGTFVSFSHSGAAHHAETSGGDSVSEHAQAAGDDIKDTFLGIGGDLQQFFTGERTVDK
jgi:hypothetical protein